MEYAFRYVCCDEGQDMFSDIASVKSSNQPVELVFSVIAATNELLIDNLILGCIIQHTILQDGCSPLRGARLYDSVPLIESLQFHIPVNMESMLRSNLLDDLQGDAFRAPSSFKSGVTGQPYGSKILRSHSSPNRAKSVPSTQSHRWALSLARTSSPNPLEDSTAICATVASRSKRLPLSSFPLDILPGVTPPVDSSPSPVWKRKGVSRSIECQDLGEPDGHGGCVPDSEQAYRRVPSSRHARIAGFCEIHAQALPSGASRQSLRMTLAADTSSSASSPWKAVPKTAVSIAESNLEARAAPSFAPGSPPAGPFALSTSGLARAIQAYTASVPGSEGSPAQEKPGAPGIGPVINPVRLSSYGGISVITKAGEEATLATVAAIAAAETESDP
ncbi:hypothetical protein FRC04_001206 [Tulasnella sp. 424]|nr:hypothetical protein FRC04_001206 [Tulasnella sp. 424]